MQAAPLLQYLSETTVHGLIHFTGQRKIYVKLFWAIAFAVSFGFCGLRVSDAINKFISKDSTTTVRENALDFEFPDVYLCNESPVSGSCSANIDSDSLEELDTYRRLANASVSAMAFNGSDTAFNNYAIRLANTLPFQFLSEQLGQRPRSVVFDCLQGECDAYGAVVFYHPYHVNCYQLNVTASDWAALRNPSNSISVILFVDPLLPAMDTSPPDFRAYYNETVNLKPVDWDLESGTDFARPTGFRLYLTPRGQYPSDFDAQIFAGPGMQHRVHIKMQDTVYNEVDFAGQCSGDSEATADFLDPFSGGKLTFKYSQAVCWFREIYRMSRDQYNCSIIRKPIPWEFASVPSCFNMTAAGDRRLPGDVFYRPASELLNAARKSCDNKMPCRSRSYSFQYSSSSWPSRRVWQDYLKTLINQLDADDHNLGIQYLVTNGTFADVKDSLLQIELSALSTKSQEVQLSLAYGFNSLIADVGGLLGLFLGMSLLSALELVELLHNWALLAFPARRKAATTPATSVGGSVDNLVMAPK